MDFKKVKSGDKLNIPAKTYNAFIDAAQANKARNNFLSASNKNSDSRKVLVQNDSGGNLDKFEILGIDSPIVDPDDNETDFQERITISGVTPEDGSGGSGSDDHSGKFIVLQEPIPDGKIGRGIISGETIVKIDVVDEDHKFADVTDSTSTYLTSGNSGSARILWKESGTGVVWAYVILGDSAGGAERILVNDSGETINTGYVCAFTIDTETGKYILTKPDEDSMHNIIVYDGVSLADTKETRTIVKAEYTAQIDGDFDVGDIVGTQEDSWEMTEGNEGAVVVADLGSGLAAVRIPFSVGINTCRIDSVTEETTYTSPGNYYSTVLDLKNVGNTDTYYIKPNTRIIPVLSFYLSVSTRDNFKSRVSVYAQFISDGSVILENVIAQYVYSGDFLIGELEYNPPSSELSSIDSIRLKYTAEFFDPSVRGISVGLTTRVGRIKLIPYTLT